MSRENVEVLRRFVDAFNRHDIGALAQLCTDDVEFVSVLTVLDAGGATYSGPDAWETYFAHMDQVWDGWRVENLEIFEAGEDRAAAVFHIAGRGKTTGVPVQRAVGVSYSFRGGKLWRLRSHLDPMGALEAVGLRD
jgi:ketosteroid isomerase-like protein